MCVCVFGIVRVCAWSELGISSGCLSFSCNFYVHSIRYRYAMCYVKLIYKQSWEGNPNPVSQAFGNPGCVEC